MSKNNNNNNQIDLFNEITSQLAIFYSAIVQKTDNPLFELQALKRKNLSQLSSKIYKLLNDKQGNAKQAHQNRDIFLKIIESHLTNFVNNHVIIHLIRCTDDYSFTDVLARRWRDYKRILFSFFGLFIHVKEYYEIARVTEFNKNKNQYNKQASDSLPLPIPVIGVRLFTGLVLRRFQSRIKRSVLMLLKRQRQLCKPSNNDLRVIFEIVWSCSLKELARIAKSKQQVYFLKEQKKEFMNVFQQAANNEEFIKTYILNDVASIAVGYYADLSNSLKQLNGLQQIQMVNLKCELQEDIARFHLPSKASISTYLNAIYKQLILTDFDHILKKQQGFKHIISHFSHTSNELQKEVIAYFRVIKRVEDVIIDQVIKVIDEVIAQRGGQIREKLNKPREFMIEMLHFKKSLRKIFVIVETNTLKVEVAMEKGFKNLMDGYEVSKSLAEFADFTIRQCIRLKLDESSSEQRMKQVMFILTSVSAKDLFLAYHQEAMTKRLLDCLSESKFEPQLQLLRLLADNLGNIMMSQHFSMIKDVQNSIEVTEHISQLLPFISYKWELRVINSSAWPDSALKIRFTHIQPPQMLRVHLYQLQDLYKQYRGFTLQWKLDRGTSLFQGKFLKGKWRFQAENIYLIILLHLNQQPNCQITYSKISQLINNQKKDTDVNHLQNCLKVLLENRLILRVGQSQNFEPSEVLAVNLQYTPTEPPKPGQTILIKMSQQLAKILNQNNVEINKVLKDRQRLVDALLVKLLKHAHATGSNRITFLQLYEGIKTNPFLSNFNFTQTTVKERLQQLISKEYCRRDEEDRRIYHYIA